MSNHKQFWKLDQTPMLQLGPDFFDPVEAAVFKEPQLRFWNDSLDIHLNKERFYDFLPIKDNLPKPLALRYHGHQFQHYNPELGDGRGFLYAQIKKQTAHASQWYDLGTKGSGQTPYSRNGDGRLTLKGAVREALATEMLNFLGVQTSKTLCFYETAEKLVRYDEPSPTRSAVLTRFSKGHIRIGTFQRLAYFKQIPQIKKLVSYCLHFYFQDEITNLDFENETLVAARFLLATSKANTDLVASVMMAGFIHGVLNTDNINISGELFDYGPYRFMPEYDPQFTAAYFDQQGLYCYGRQPISFLWALERLAECLKLAYPELPTKEILETFSESFQERIQTHFLKKLRLQPKGFEADQKLLSLFFHFLETEHCLFEEVFFNFSDFRYQNNSKLLDQYRCKNELNEFIKHLEQYQTDNAILNKNFQTLLIDEIESIWKDIDKNDDWSAFESKISNLRIK